jgi:alkylation response protein AidB-like acyl-CoA dehydrogenase
MRNTVDFLLYDWLGVEALCTRERYADHSRETFDAVLDTCERIAEEQFTPHNRTVDVQEPRQQGEAVILPEGAYEAARAYVASGMLAAVQDHAVGGMQLPFVIDAAANAFFAKAGVGLGGAGMLTIGNANLLMAHGTAAQKRVFAQNEIDGRWFGTMCLSEPQAGSSLSDIATRAVPDGDDYAQDPLGPRYRLYGNKMWISNGEHDLAENIVHLVLAKVPGPDGKLTPGTKGISLFVVPRNLADDSGQLTGVRNDVALAGLNHKLGCRGIPNTLLNFGEGRYPVDGRAGAVGYRVGAEGEGLRCMFHMMNEARIAVGLGAVALGYAGYEASLEYARSRRQGRPMTAAGKDPSSPPVPIVEHADVKRMLLAQKAYAEGGLALGLYCGRLIDEARTGSADDAAAAKLLLEILTPIAKSWPSEWCLEANSLAIQVLGGYGYTRDFPVEQYWRDNRLNMIHEGTHGIQALDLLGRKVSLAGGQAMALLIARIEAAMEAAPVELQDEAAALREALGLLRRATASALGAGDPERALCNATPYLQAFGHVVIAWLWLEVATAAMATRSRGAEQSAFLAGKRQAARYFYGFELPKVAGWLDPVARRDVTCLDMQDAWFAT